MDANYRTGNNAMKLKGMNLSPIKDRSNNASNQPTRTGWNPNKVHFTNQGDKSQSNDPIFGDWPFDMYYPGLFSRPMTQLERARASKHLQSL